MACSNLCRANFPWSTTSTRGRDGGAAIVFADSACCGTASLGIAKTDAHKPARTNRRMLRSQRRFISPPVDRRSCLFQTNRLIQTGIPDLYPWLVQSTLLPPWTQRIGPKRRPQEDHGGVGP